MLCIIIAIRCSVDQKKIILWNTKKPFEGPVFLISLSSWITRQIISICSHQLQSKTIRMPKRRELQKQNIGGLSLHDRRCIKMINDGVSNKDFIDCGFTLSCSTSTPFGAAFQANNSQWWHRIITVLITRSTFCKQIMKVKLCLMNQKDTKIKRIFNGAKRISCSIQS